MSDRSRWRATSAWIEDERPAPPERGGRAEDVHLERLGPAALATIIVAVGREADLERVIKEQLGCGLPGSGKVAFGRDADLVWSAPGQWLAVGKAESSAVVGLETALSIVAAVTDQSDSRALLRVSGARARDVLARGFAIDLHPRAFSAGSTGVTKVAHLSVQIWQTDNIPTYMIAVPRSFAGSFWSWLSGAAAPLV